MSGCRAELNQIGSCSVAPVRERLEVEETEELMRGNPIYYLLF